MTSDLQKGLMSRLHWMEFQAETKQPRVEKVDLITEKLVFAE
jgi:hypothetical protein